MSVRFRWSLVVMCSLLGMLVRPNLSEAKAPRMFVPPATHRRLATDAFVTVRIVEHGIADESVQRGLYTFARVVRAQRGTGRSAATIALPRANAWVTLRAACFISANPALPPRGVAPPLCSTPPALFSQPVGTLVTLGIHRDGTGNNLFYFTVEDNDSIPQHAVEFRRNVPAHYRRNVASTASP